MTARLFYAANPCSGPVAIRFFSAALLALWLSGCLDEPCDERASRLCRDCPCFETLGTAVTRLEGLIDRETVATRRMQLVWESSARGGTVAVSVSGTLERADEYPLAGTVATRYRSAELGVDLHFNAPSAPTVPDWREFDNFYRYAWDRTCMEGVCALGIDVDFSSAITDQDVDYRYELRGTLEGCEGERGTLRWVELP